MEYHSRKLHLGCGPGPMPKGWINIDGSWNARLTKYPILYRVLQALRLIPDGALRPTWDPAVMVHDVTKGIPFPDNTMTAIYSSHMLEHLYLVEAQRLLQECYRVLQPGATLRIVVPDLHTFVGCYMREREKLAGSDTPLGPYPADKLNELLHFRSSHPSSEKAFVRVYNALRDFHSHKWMYDADSLAGYFRRAGFVEVEEKELHRSRIEGIEEVEKPDRILGGAGVCVEGNKPKSDLTKSEP